MPQTDFEPSAFAKLALSVWQPEDYKVSERIQAYWTSFARVGAPANGPSLSNRLQDFRSARDEGR